MVQWRKQSRFDCVDPLSRNIIATEKFERERERGIEKNFLSPSFDYRAEERKITEKGQKQREREIVGILIRLDEKGKKKKEMQILSTNVFYFLTFGQLNLRTL